MDRAVIGRRKIDSYVLYFTYINKIPLIDVSSSCIVLLVASSVVIGIHQGRDTYKNHINNKSNDYYYNSRFYNDRNQKKATVQNCRFYFGNFGAYI